MRPNVMTRALVGITAVAGLAAGSLAGAGTAFATAQPAAATSVGAQDVSVLAVNNLGLNTRQAKHRQCWLKGEGYSLTVDGQLGPDSWKAAQKFFDRDGWYVGGKLVVDGVVGANTIKALRNFLGVGIDGIAGPTTRSAFAYFNDVNWCSA